MSLTVHAPCGDLRGRNENGVAVFRNIPYAAAPMGELRFQPPAPLQPWAGVRDASTPGAIPPQGKSRLSAITGGDVELPQSEDCLTLEVRHPSQPGSARPVLVWIHGGGFVGGAGSHPWYSGTSLAQKGDAVLVNVNYRQGALGHLYVPGVSEGNLALLDIVAALRWVRTNISAFGGTPGAVTLFGQSSGAAAIAALLQMPSAEGLFQRVILQSPPLGRNWRASHQAAALGQRYADLLKTSDREPRKFLTASIPELLTAQGEFMRSFPPPVLGASEQPFGPVVENRTLHSQEDAWALKPTSRLEILIGTVRDEQASSLVLDEKFRNATLEQFRQVLEFFAPGRAAEAYEFYVERGRGKSPGQMLAAFYTDILFRLDVIRFADRHTRKGDRVWLYQFEWESPAGLGACHCIELPFVFGSLENFSDAPMLRGMDAGIFRDLSEAMQMSWLAFAHTGDPRSAATSTWQEYDSSTRMSMRLDSNCVAVSDPAGYARHPLRDPALSA